MGTSVASGENMRPCFFVLLLCLLLGDSRSLASNGFEVDSSIDNGAEVGTGHQEPATKETSPKNPKLLVFMLDG